MHSDHIRVTFVMISCPNRYGRNPEVSLPVFSLKSFAALLAVDYIGVQSRGAKSVDVVQFGVFVGGRVEAVVQSCESLSLPMQSGVCPGVGYVVGAYRRSVRRC